MYKSILHATDLSENHFSICQKAVMMAKSMQAKIFFLHVIETPSSLQWAQSLGFAELATPVKDDANTVMQTLADNFKIPLENFFVEIGSAYSIILSKIKELSSDLIILGDHESSSISAIHGSTANAVIHHANCDVLTIKS